MTVTFLAIVVLVVALLLYFIIFLGESLAKWKRGSYQQDSANSWRTTRQLSIDGSSLPHAITTRIEKQHPATHMMIAHLNPWIEKLRNSRFTMTV